jgi:hypothetical protein
VPLPELVGPSIVITGIMVCCFVIGILPNGINYC